MIPKDAPLIICFPPGAGGNHLRNMIVDDALIDQVYNNSRIKHAHASGIKNFDLQDLDRYNITHGHFGEIISHQHDIRLLEYKRWILIGAEDVKDRELLHFRRRALGMENLNLGEYFDGEQVFLYEASLYHDLFGSSFDDIINVSIKELFCEDVLPLLSRLSDWLDRQLNLIRCGQMHRSWYEKNFAKTQHG